jgi:acetyl esterase/lipase
LQPAIVKPLAIGAVLPLLWLGMVNLSQGQTEEPRKILTTSDVLRFPTPPPDLKIPYGPDPFEFGELRLPKTPSPFPVAIIIHGGCWLAEYDLHHISSFSAALTQHGIATLSLEYRRVGNPGGGWPGTFMDVANGADHLRAISLRYHLDLSRVVVVGHSAGGHLALWLASRRLLPEQSPLHSADPLPLRGVVALAGVPDLVAGSHERVCDDSIDRLMGGTPATVPERYRFGSPRELLPLHVPQRLVHGALDSIVPLKIAKEYTTAATEAGDDVVLTVVPNAGHFEMIAPGTSAWDVIKQDILDLLKRGTKD